jgi:hypothetical protein
MNDELGREWMEADEAQSRYYPEIFLEKLKKPKQKLGTVSAPVGIRTNSF